MNAFIHPFQKLQSIARLTSGHRRQLWVVAYVDQEKGRTGYDHLIEQAYADIESSFEHGQKGADAVVLINEWCSLQELETVLSAVRKRYPRVPLGVNYLGDDAEPYGYRDSFRLARDYGLQIVWTDFSGVDLIQERKPVDLHAIQAERPSEVFYCSGIHMKYSTLQDPTKTIEQSALQAMGWVDGVIVTGPKTGVACNPETALRASRAMGHYPLGVASGVSPENVHTIRDVMDFFLVASSLQDSAKRIRADRVRELREKIGGETV